MFAPPIPKTKPNTTLATVPNHALRTVHHLPGRPAGSVAAQVGKLQRKIEDQRSSRPSGGGLGVHDARAGAAQPRCAALAHRSDPADVCEQEAEEIAGRIVRTPEPPSPAGPGGGGRPEGPRERPDHHLAHAQTDRVPAAETAQGAVPAIVQDVLRSSGQPLEPVTRGFMEQRFGHDFSRIRIHADPAAARAAAALGAEAFAFGRHIAFARDRFSPGTAQGKRLVAHELTHTIQQAATSPYLALRPETRRRAPAPGRSRFDGALLGTGPGPNKPEVRVAQEVGGTQGYDHRLQAIAVARLANAEPAAVALGTDGKWHAFVATGELATAATGGNTPFVQAEPLSSRTGIGPALQRMHDLRTTMAAIDQVEKEWTTDPEFRNARRGMSPPFPRRLQAQREATRQEQSQATQTAAAVTLGVPESEILRIGSLSSRVAGKVNIVGSPDQRSTGGAHAPLGGINAFEEGRASAIHIDLSELDNPVRAQKVLFHEAQHKFDWDFAQQWIRNYRAETGRLFVKQALAPFKNWLDAQAKRGRLTKADVELIMMQVQDTSAYTEARANVREFLAALQAGAPDAAEKSLVAYARGLKPMSQGGQYAGPVEGSQVVAALIQELRTAYAQMPNAMRQQYDAAVAAAKQENPDAWISKLDFAKRPRR